MHLSALQSEAGDLGDSKNEENFQRNKGSTVRHHFTVKFTPQFALFLTKAKGSSKIHYLSTQS